MKKRPIRQVNQIVAQDGGALSVLATAQAWAGLVGEWIAQRSRPVAFRKGVLTIGADSPVLANELKLQAESEGWLEALNQALDRARITELKFKTAGAPAAAPRSKAPASKPLPPPQPARRLSQEELDRAQTELDQVADPELRARLLRLRRLAQPD